MMDDNFAIPSNLSDLDTFLAERETAIDLKEGTEAQIIWNSETGIQKTGCSIVYLHGFRATHPEGDPVHHTIAKTLGCNLYLSRLEEHGTTSPYPLLNLTEEKLLRSALFGLEIGKRIGEKVILMGTSTGGSLALWLASQDRYRDVISSLVLYSPLIRFYGIKEQLLMNSWGRNMLSYVPGTKHLVKTKGMTYAEEKIWDKEYALQGALALGAFVEHYMQPDLFSKITCPVFSGHYYKSKKEQDQIVSVTAIKNMIHMLGTRSKLVNSTNFPEAQTHVICSSLLSNAVPQVIEKTELFLKNVASHITSKND